MTPTQEGPWDTREALLVKCCWGGCDDEAVASRWTEGPKGALLPVCAAHASSPSQDTGGGEGSAWDRVTGYDMLVARLTSGRARCALRDALTRGALSSYEIAWDEGTMSYAAYDGCVVVVRGFVSRAEVLEWIELERCGRYLAAVAAALTPRGASDAA